MSAEPANALTEQITRCEELLEAYRSIGRAGQFGQTMIITGLDNARVALASGRSSSMREMVSELKALK